MEQRVVEWFPVEWSGGTTNVAVLPPQEVGSGPHPVVFALSWGSGSASLVMGFLEAYWGWEPGNRGYYVVAPEVTGSTLADTADELIPAIFAFMDTQLSYDPAQVALVGASNGGRGIFHAALSQPDRFQALLGLPGMYAGDPQNLAVLADKPVWLLVGELDQGWVDGTQTTADALTALGIDVTVDVEEGQDHVLVLNPVRLMDWIDGALGR
jgi:pimeloyl-ACP methyl ester carboxylesterase